MKHSHASDEKFPRLEKKIPTLRKENSHAQDKKFPCSGQKIPTLG
jgi:hypothetical protein